LVPIRTRRVGTGCTCIRPTVTDTPEIATGPTPGPGLARWYVVAALVVAGLILQFVLGPSTPVLFDIGARA
jgi:hypothetical protein